jgi:hypothetical protein
MHTDVIEMTSSRSTFTAMRTSEMFWYTKITLTHITGTSLGKLASQTG